MISGAAGAMTIIMGNITKEDGPLKEFTREERVEHVSLYELI